MDITFNCTNCGQKLEIDESRAGISIDCPKCGKPVYVPTQPGASSQQPPIKVTVKPTQKSSFVPPSIEGGLHCLFIAAVLMVVGFVLFRMRMVASMICYAVASPFLVGALLCAIYGICKGSIKHGLALLAGVGVLCALIMFGPLWAAAKIHTLVSPLMEDSQKLMEQLLKQHQ